MERAEIPLASAVVRALTEDDYVRVWNHVAHALANTTKMQVNVEYPAGFELGMAVRLRRELYAKGYKTVRFFSDSGHRRIVVSPAVVRFTAKTLQTEMFAEEVPAGTNLVPAVHAPGTPASAPPAYDESGPQFH